MVSGSLLPPFPSSLMDDGPRPFPNHPGGRPTGSLPICLPRVPQEAYRGDGESFFLNVIAVSPPFCRRAYCHHLFEQPLQMAQPYGLEGLCELLENAGVAFFYVQACWTRSSKPGLLEGHSFPFSACRRQATNIKAKLRLRWGCCCWPPRSHHFLLRPRQ